MAQDWQNRLKNLLAKRQDPPERERDREGHLDESRREIARFFEETVLPAFYTLKAELKEYGREVEIEKSAREASLTVYKDGVEEFSYAIRGHAYHNMTFAFPEIGDPSEAPRVYRAEVDLADTETEAFDFDEFTQENIIQDFLDNYAKWLED